MADPIYELSENPVYNETIRAVQDSDPALASAIFTPLFTAMLNNTHFVKLLAEQTVAALSDKVSQQTAVLNVNLDTLIPDDQEPIKYWRVYNPTGALPPGVGADSDLFITARRVSGEAWGRQTAEDVRSDKTFKRWFRPAADGSMSFGPWVQDADGAGLAGKADAGHTHTAEQTGALPLSGGITGEHFSLYFGTQNYTRFWADSSSWIIDADYICIGDKSSPQIDFTGGSLNMNGYELTGVRTPAESSDAANKAYVDGKTLVFKNAVADPANGFSDTGTEIAGLGFEYVIQIPLPGVTQEHRPDVAFSVTDAMSGNYAPVAYCFDGTVDIFCRMFPSAPITIPSIVCIKGE